MRLVEQDPCFINALADEPAFVLLARDESAPKLVRQWAAIRSSLISTGLKPESDRRQIAEAYALANQMEAWRRDADEAWRKQGQLAFPPVSGGETLSEEAKAALDVMTYGTGVMRDDKHVPLDQVFAEHMLHSQGDEWFCVRCKKRWATNEPAPPCA